MKQGLQGETRVQTQHDSFVAHLYLCRLVSVWDSQRTISQAMIKINLNCVVVNFQFMITWDDMAMVFFLFFLSQFF